jgi:hypothetical protein
VRFGFAPGSPGVSLPDSVELERRIDAALSEFGGAVAATPAPASSGVERRCSICATVLTAGMKSCPTCGMTN